MSNWHLQSICDYWDYNKKAIDRLSRELERTPKEQQQSVQDDISQIMQAWVATAEIEPLQRAAVIAAEDLYKAASHMSHWDWALENYLLASAGAFFMALRQRGYSVHYVVDNTYADLTGPIQAFPVWYRVTGLQYICPQEIAYRLSDLHAEIDPGMPLDPMRLVQVPTHMAKACEIANKLMNQCYERHLSFIFLTADSEAAGVSAAMNTRHLPGVIHLFRNQVPEPKTKCAMVFPAEPRSDRPAG